MEKIQKYKKGAFEKYLDNVIMESDYRQYIEQYDNRLIELGRHIRALSSISDAEGARQGVDVTEESLDKLERRVVIELIDKIEVGVDGSLTVYYKFGNP